MEGFQGNFVDIDRRNGKTQFSVTIKGYYDGVNWFFCIFSLILTSAESAAPIKSNDTSMSLGR